jgi:antitoxin component YwqK of YwqJK toxin-antitoxin module
MSKLKPIGSEKLKGQEQINRILEQNNDLITTIKQMGFVPSGNAIFKHSQKPELTLTLVGDYINYYPNGQIKDICIYEDGRKNGEYKEFYDNGKLKAEGNYEQGNLVGYELRYDIDGNFIEKVFVDDNMDEEDYNKSFKI